MAPFAKYMAVTVALCALALSACDGKAKKNGSYGGAHFHVVTSALDASDVASVTVTVQATSISDQLSNTSQGWTGVIGEIPVGSQTFLIVAYDASSNEIFWNGSGGTSTTITEGGTAIVDVLLQQFMAPTPFADTAPVISSVTASSSAVGPGDVVNLVVNATSPVGAILSYAWTDNGGAFGTPGLSTTTWTAPGIQQSYNISIEVSDPSGATVGVTLSIDDSTANQTGSASVVAAFNAWPVVNSFTASLYRIDLTQTTDLNVSATSPSGDTLSYAWSDNGCGGSFNNNSATPRYTAPSSGPAGYPNTATCDLEASITDGQGGSNTASLTIQIGPVQNVEDAPVLTASLQSQAASNAGDVVTFSVTGSDPLGGSLMWSWAFSPADTTAALSGEMDTATSSSIDFTTGSLQASYTVTVTATNAAGSTSQSFTIAPNTVPGFIVPTGASTDPAGIAFDGTNMWVVLYSSNQVLEIDGSTGSILNTIAVGTSPVGIVFDGTNMWVTNNYDATLSKINVSTATVVDTVNLGGGFGPWGIAFDGTDVWVNLAADGGDFEYKASTDAFIQGVSTGNNPEFGVVFDGTHIWVANAGDQTFSEILASTGAVLTTIPAGYPAGGSGLQGMVFDGTYVWAANYTNSQVIQIDAASATVVGQVATGNGPRSACFDGTNVWVVNSIDSTVTEIKPSTATVLGTFPVAGGGAPYACAYDGADIWVTTGTANTVQKL